MFTSINKKHRKRKLSYHNFKSEIKVVLCNFSNFLTLLRHRMLSKVQIINKYEHNKELMRKF
jgi:hypothetical protein